MKKMELSTKRKVGMGVSIAAVVAGIGGVLYGLFGHKRNTMSEEDYDIEDGDDAVEASYSEEETTES